MGKRCQVCDGPIVNGRCKYCGMPYRNDAVMYHLNEDRSEHYRHSSAKVRREMDQSEIPLPDRKGGADYTKKKMRRYYVSFKYDLEFVLSAITMHNLKDKEMYARIKFSVDINKILKEKRKKDGHILDGDCPSCSSYRICC